MKIIIYVVAAVFCFSVPVSTMKAAVIYTVNENDSLWEISRNYGTSMELLQRINGIRDPDVVVPGQSLLLPGQEYIVREGDSLWTIANLHQTSTDRLQQINGLSSSVLHPGQTLTIPESRRQRIRTGAFFEPSTPAENEQALTFYRRYLSSVGFFEYRPDENGQLSRLSGDEAVTTAWKKGMTPYATITNLTEEGFDAALAHTLLSHPEKRQHLIGQIAHLVDEKQYKGVIIDFESLDVQDRRSYQTFVRELGKRMDAVGGKTGLALPPMQGAREPSHHAAYDYEGLGTHADFVFLMTYDWSWPGGKAGPIAPINKVDETIQYASSVIPADKIYLGFAMYAYDWLVSGEDGQNTAYSQQEALNKASKNFSTITYHVNRATPSFRYRDNNGAVHEVWFEDARSLLAKYRLVKKYDLKGLGGWKTGLRFPQAGYLLKDEFMIE
ncbi:LysM peptidoglycan-binding domain-containing protein [Salibacterium sp. K-3]